MAEVIRNIELRPHIGYTDSGVEVRFKQDIIMLNGIQVGYATHGPGGAINLIRPTDQATKDAIVAKVAELRGTQPGKVAEAPTLTDEEQLDLAEGIKR